MFDICFSSFLDPSLTPECELPDRNKVIDNDDDYDPHRIGDHCGCLATGRCYLTCMHGAKKDEQDAEDVNDKGADSGEEQDAAFRLVVSWVYLHR